MLRGEEDSIADVQVQFIERRNPERRIACNAVDILTGPRGFRKSAQRVFQQKFIREDDRDDAVSALK